MTNANGNDTPLSIPVAVKYLTRTQYQAATKQDPAFLTKSSQPNAISLTLLINEDESDTAKLIMQQFHEQTPHLGYASPSEIAALVYKIDTICDGNQAMFFEIGSEISSDRITAAYSIIQDITNILHERYQNIQ